MTKRFFLFLVISIIFPPLIKASDRTTRFGVNAFAPPYVIREEGKVLGSAPQLLEKVFAAMGEKLDLEALSNQRISLSFRSGDIDAALYLSDYQKLIDDKFAPIFWGPQLIDFRNGYLCLQKDICDAIDKDPSKLRVVAFQSAQDNISGDFSKLTKKFAKYIEVTNQREQVVGLLAGDFDLAFGDEKILRYHIDIIANSSHPLTNKAKNASFHHRLYPHPILRQTAFRSRELRDRFTRAYKALGLKPL